MSSRIDKTIARQEEKIAEGNFYEAHQQLRVIATRYVKANSWDLASDILARGASALLKAGQGASGGDLCLYLLNVYEKSQLQPSPETKGRIFTLLRAFPPGEPTFKQFANEAIAWNARLGEFPTGDPELHHVIGTLFSQNLEPHEAEKHLALGTRDSPEVLARLEFDWYLQDESHTAHLYAARAIFPYLITENLRSAVKAYIIFTSRLSLEKSSLGEQEVSSSTAEIRLFPSMPLLNFTGFLLLACQRGSSELFRQLTRHYAPYLSETEQWSPVVDYIGEIWFGLKIARRNNPLLDMMGDMLFGSKKGHAGAHKVLSHPPANSSSNPPPPELD